jgi:MFS family permease
MANQTQERQTLIESSHNFSLNERWITPGEEVHDGGIRSVDAEVLDYVHSHDNVSNSNDGGGAVSINVSRIILFSWFAFTGRSMWSQSVLSVFVFLLKKNHPECVGIVTGVMGVSQVLASLPPTTFCRSRRDRRLKLASLVGIAAVTTTFFALWQLDYNWLLGASILWGIMWGISDAALNDLFLDSIPTSRRSHYYKRASSVIRLGNLTGPLVAIVIFRYMGEEQWSLRGCSLVMMVGLGLCLPGLGILCSLREEPEQHDPPAEINCQDYNHQDTSFTTNDLLGQAPESAIRQQAIRLASDVDPMESVSHQICHCKPNIAIPTLVTIADALSEIASGLSLRYFPIFFLDQLRLSPVQVQVLNMVTPFGSAILKKFARSLARRYGPSRVSASFQWIFVSLLVSMVMFYKQGRPVVLVCTFYIFHASMMNSTSALSRSIVADAVPKENMGKWNALDPLHMLLWSGSAILGGILVSFYGVLVNFYVSAGLQLLASLPFLALFNSDAIMSEDRRAESESRGSSQRFLRIDEDTDLSSIPLLNSDIGEDETAYEASRNSLESDLSEFHDCLSIDSASRNDDGSPPSNPGTSRELNRYMNPKCMSKTDELYR